MFISRLYKLNRLTNPPEKFHFYYSNQMYKLVSASFSTSLDKNLDGTENLNKAYKFNTGEYLSIHKSKFLKMELIISNLDKYSYKNFDEDFYPLLIHLHRNLLFISKTQCRKIPSLYSILDRIRFKIFKFNSTQENFKTLDEAKGILYFIYLLEKKNIYNITREENNLILPKILKFMEANHKVIEIADLIETIQILCHFGIAFNLRLVEFRIKKEIKFVNFDKLNHIIKNLRDNKNNKLNYFKTIILNLILLQYKDTGLQENINDKLSLISNLTYLCIDIPVFEAYNEISQIMQAIIREFLLNERAFDKLDPNSILNLFETICNLYKIKNENSNNFELELILTSRDFLNLINKIYDHISTKMIYNDNQSISRVDIDKSHTNKNIFFNLPLLLLFIKYVSSIESHLLPKDDHIKGFFRYIKNNLTNSENVHREALFCYKLMERTSCLDSELAEMLRKYLINQIHFIDVEKYPLRYFIDSFKTTYKNDKQKLKENILKPITDNFLSLMNFRQSNHKSIFYFKLFMNSCVVSSGDYESQDISDKLFGEFINILRENRREETLKEACKILEYFLSNKESFNRKYEDDLNDTLITILDDNRDQFVFLDLMSTKVMLFLDHLDMKEESKTFQKRDVLIRHILDSKYKFTDQNLKILNEFRMLAENNISIHPNSLIRVVCYMKNKKLEISEDQLENLMKFIFIILRKSKFENSELQKLNSIAINDLVLFVNLKSYPITSLKINIFATLEIVSKILKIYGKQIDYEKLNSIFEELKLLSIYIPKHKN